MAISFSLRLTPNNIEFLQQLDLYADGLIPISEVGVTSRDRSLFVSHIRKLIREGLVEHVIPKAGETRYEGGRGDGLVIRAYKITEKGQKVLSLIESDVQAFLGRQKAYQKAKKKRA